MSSASNSLAREFLSDVSHLCNAVDQRVEAKEEEEEKTHIAALGQYLIQGRGFVLLTKLNSIIDQELTCREDLLTLLLSLLPLVWKIPVDKEKAIDFNLPFSVEICLTKETTLSSLKPTQEKQNIGENVHLSAQASGKLNSSWKNRRQRKTTHRYSVRDARKSQISTSDSEGNSDEKTSAMIRHRRPQLLQPFPANQSKDQSVTSGCNFIESEMVQSCNYGRENSQQFIPVQESIVQVSDESVTPSASYLDNSPFDLCHVLLSLLEKICKFDIALNHKSALAASVIGTLTEFLSKLGDCYNINSAAENEAVSSSWTEESVALVQRMLFRTVLHLMAVDVNNADTMPGNLRKNLTDLLKAALKVKCILDALFSPFPSRSQGTLQNILQVNFFSQNRHRFLLLPEFIEGVLQILICCLQSAASNPIYFSQAMDLIHEFIQQQGFKLFETTALQMEGLCARGPEVNTEASEYLKALINSIMKIISTIKKVKSEQLHQSVCARKRHRRCEYSHFMHHHRDLSGLPVSAFKYQASKSPFEETADGEVHYPDRCCCVAVCAHQCLRLLQKLSLNSTCFQILTGIHNVGICCCMDPKSVISPLLHSFRSQTFKNFQPHILSILNKFILEQLGGLQISQKVTHASCNICSIDGDQLAELDDFLHGNAAEVSVSSSSAPYRFQGILPSRGSENMFLKWDALEAYQSLVFEDDDKLRCMQIAGHICSLIQKGNEIIQWKLYNYIFSPVLQRGVELAHYSQQTGTTTAFSQTSGYQKTCFSQEVLQIYLQTLPILFKSRIIQELFLSCNGINQITELNYLDGVRAYSLKVFETLIVSLGEQQTDQLMPDLESLDSEEKVLALDLDVAVHRQQMVSYVPQSLSKFYAGLKEINPKRKKSVSQDVHLNMINIFLCVTFLCVSKEAEADRDSTNDSEDTSGYDSTASEPFSHKLPCLSFESLTLPSLEYIQRAADTWSMCRSIYLCNAVFQRQFHRLGGFEVCHRLIAMIIEKLGVKEEKEEGMQEKPTEFLLKNCSSQLIMNNEKGQSDNTDENLENIGQQKSISYQHSDAEQASTDGTAESKHVLMQENDWMLQGIRLLEALLAICLHSATNFQQKAEMESLQNICVEDILLEMREQLTKARVMETELVKPLFDSLLRVALGTYFTDLDHSEEKKEKIHQSEKEPVPRPDDISEEADESQCYCFKFFAEEKGYDADSESNSDDNESKDEGKYLSSEEQGCFGYCSVPSDLAENIIQGELIYPELCMLELHLLFVGSPSLDVLTHVFHSFLKVVRLKEKNATLLMEQVCVLVVGFTQHTRHRHMDLLVSLMSSSTSSEELTLLLRIFLEKTPATGILLKGILKILEANTRMRPLQHIVFPLHQISSLGSSPCQKSAPTFCSKTVALLRRAKLVQSKKEPEGESLPHHLLSPWHVAPIHLPLVGQNCWPHMSEGFSISLWFSTECIHRAGSSLEKSKKMKRRSKSLISHESSFDEADKLLEDGCLHIFSLGSKALMIQVWANVNSGTFTFRMCMDPNDDMKAGLLAQAETPENTFLVGKWQHLALTYIEQPENKKNIHGTLLYGFVVRGMLFQDYKYYTGSPQFMTKIEPKIYVQHVLKHKVWCVCLPVGATVGPEEAFHLYACGPDFTSIMPCKYGKSIPNYSKYIDKEILQCEQIKELLLTKKEVDTGPLIENLATVYTTCCPGYYTIYEPVIRLKGQAKTIPSQRPFSSKEVQSNLSDPHYLKTLQPAEYKGLQGILHEIGGIGSFVFLFARVVEISSCEETQALALKIILVLTKHNQQRIHELENCNGYSMIHQVLLNSKCIVGFHILQTLLEGCCNEKMIHQDDNGQFMLDVESRAIIQDVKLLEELMFDWKIWSKAQQGVWKTLLSALEILIQDNHWQQLFNIKQLLKAQVVHHFLRTCQVLQEHKEEHFTSIPSEVCTSFVKIIEEVLGSPPDLKLLTLIFNFLVAVHPATNTYVCHNPRDFYFSLHIDGNIFQEKVQSIMFMRNSSSGGKSVDSPVLAMMSPVRFSAVHLPSSPISSPRMHPGGFLRNIGWSAENLHEVTQPKRVEPLQKNNLIKHTEAFKRSEEEHFISSCESAKTVVGLAEVTPAETLGISREEIELLDKTSENHEKVPGMKPSEYNVIPELSLKRPDNLKGLSPIQKSHGNFAGLGLAFSIPSGATVYRWPSYKNVPSEDWEHLTFSSANEWAPQKFESVSTEDCLVLICHGLYHLLRRILLILPDVMLPDVLDKLIQPDIFIVLVNHPSTLIQQGVIKLLNTYFSRATREQKEKFLKNRGFSLLANQLYLHQGTQELMECFLEMLFGRSVGLDEDFDLEDVKNAGLFQKWSVIPVLGLIENSLHDCILLHNFFCFLLQIINSCPKISDMLLDNGLLYVICNTLATLNGLEANILSNDSRLLVCDIQQLLAAVTIHACSCSGIQYFRIIEDLMVLLGHLQMSKMTEHGVKMAVNLQFTVLQSAVKYIKTVGNPDSEHLSNSLHLSFEDYQAIFQKRKSIAAARTFSIAQSETFLMRMHAIANDELDFMVLRRMSQDSSLCATEAELTQRLQRITVLTTNRFMYQDLSENCPEMIEIPFQNRSSRIVSQQDKTEKEDEQKELTPRNTFFREMFKIMIEGIGLSIGTSRLSTPKQQWKKILLSCKDTFRVQLGRLLVHALSPTRSLQERKHILEFLHEINHQEILRECLICTFLVGCSAWEKIMANNWQTLFQRLETKSKEISKIAGDITQAASLSQGMERKKVIQHIRGMYKTDLSASRHWQELIQQFTHDRALWYDPASYPTSWQLDPTEGPNRERRRLQRCYLTIPNKYLLKDRQKLEEVLKPPLAYLFEDKTHSSHSSTVKDKAASEHIRVNRRCINVAPSRETPGELLLGKSFFPLTVYLTKVSDSYIQEVILR
uniref:Lysosomal trafficking regulator n=1 Tax=Naja naja TaxID=35670 RepID=A0A8C6VCC8_NAJNA